MGGLMPIKNVFLYLSRWFGDQRSNSAENIPAQHPYRPTGGKGLLFNFNPSLVILNLFEAVPLLC